MNKLLDVIDLSVGYKNSISNFIIENFNFYIDYSEIFGLIGPSGCGKTTIAWTLNDWAAYTANTNHRKKQDLHRCRFAG